MGSPVPDVRMRDGWNTWRFEEMAAIVNDRIDDPSEAGVQRYVGLEHLDPGSLTIRRWGSPDDVEATKLRFRAGDIIFGRRRAYQRKLAVADFDGICSAHAMVLRARPGVVLAEFLPFLMQSDVFMERAVEISVGSLSPTINWKTLAKERFALPPLEEQRQIAEALVQGELAKEQLRRLAGEHARLMDSLYGHVFGPRRLHVDLPTGTPLGSLCALRRGASPRPIHDPKWFSEVGPGWVRIRDLSSNGRFLRTTEQRLSPLGVEKSVQVWPGEVILSIAATIGRPAIADTDLCIHDGFVVFRDLSPALDRDYLFHFLRWMRPVLESKGLLGTQMNINTTIVEDLRLDTPSLAAQRRAAAAMNVVFDGAEVYERRAHQIDMISTRLLHGGPTQ